MIKYSVIIPLYNDTASLKLCLAALKKQITKEFEIIVVDDYSPKACPKAILPKGVQFLRLKKRGGAGVARNAGAKIAKGEYLIFLDADVVISPEFIKKLTRKVHPNVCLQGVYSPATPAFALASQYKNLYYYYNFFYRLGGQFHYLSSHCFIIPRRIFIEFGFNPKIKSVIEDADLALRLLKNGHKIKLEKDLQVTHLKRFSALKLLANDFKLSFSKAKHILRNFSPPGQDLIIVSGGTCWEMRGVIATVAITPLPLVAGNRSFFIIWALIFFMLNSSFFWFLKRQKGMIFLLLAMPLYYLDMLFAFAGVVAGTLSYAFGKKY